jgi:hypothetical protein
MVALVAQGYAQQSLVKEFSMLVAVVVQSMVAQ